MKMNKKVLVTGAGGGGSENLINSLRKSNLELFIYGSNMDDYLLAKSSADKTVWLPSAKEEGYTDSLRAVVEKEKIELVIPNNDTEVGRISKDRSKIPCKVFLPPHEAVEICQDKLKMHLRFEKDGIPQARSKGIETFGDIDTFMNDFPAEKYWIRPRRGSGSIGTTWVQNSEQAKAWLKLWIEMREFQLEDFIVSEFLPGRDYACKSVWKDGKLIVMKLAERLVYIASRNRLSNMSSSPAVARTVRDEAAIKTVVKAIHSITSTPHGNFCVDLKGNIDKQMCITECNIGRFFMITPIFDHTGQYNTAEVYVRCALNLPCHVDDSIDIEEDVYLIRELDTIPVIIRGNYLRSKVDAAKASLK